MPVRPALPANYNLPEAVGDWDYNHQATYNGHIWTASDQNCAVGVFNTLESVRATVMDERLNGFGRRYQIDRLSVDDSEEVPRAVARGIDQAVEWMENHDPAGWSHPDVFEPVFDPPTGYELDTYYLEKRDHTIYYRKTTYEPDAENVREAIHGSDPGIDTRPYLYIQCWRGSGNATIALSPWKNAHDHELHEIINPPEECGLAVALRLARNWVAERVTSNRDTPATGQTALNTWTS